MTEYVAGNGFVPKTSPFVAMGNMARLESQKTISAGEGMVMVPTSQYRYYVQLLYSLRAGTPFA